ncbi:MAG: 50S ribosomal protein L28 [Patescibacteria group bacterium]|nr:50S ribosomal protein L28 [Patescibacteria group bacterium]
MALKCFNCSKGRMVGRSHTHHPGVAGGRWKKKAPTTQKVFKPNLHFARIAVDGVMKRVRLCTKCLRRAKQKEVLPQPFATARV